ncbi:MAG: zinc-dependent alcohol dehydrogenase [Planctomycetota bacterium]
MKALIYHGPHDLRVEQRPEAELKPNEVRLAVRACGVCASELHAVLEAQERRRPGIIMGHEMAGEVVETGADVSRVQVGDRVAVQPLTHCGDCALCRAGRENACENRALYGMTEGLPGGFAERAVVAEDRCFPLAEGVPWELAVLGEPLAVGLHAIGRGPADAPRTVAVLGCGTIGLMTQVGLSTLGLERVFAIDKVGWKLELAEQLGATPLRAGEDEVLAAVRGATGGRGVDWTIEAVGVGETVALSLELSRVGGHVTWIGNAEPEVTVSLHAVVQAEKTVMGSYGYTDADFRRGLGLVAEGRVPAGWVADRRVTFETAPADFEALAAGAWPCLKAVFAP